MKRHLRRMIVPTLSLSLLLLAACSRAPSQSAQTEMAPAMGDSALKAPQSGAPLEKMLAQNVAQPDAQSPAVPAAKPQLIRTASLQLTVQDVDGAIGDLRNLLKQQQGDIYNFDDQRGGPGSRRHVSLELKVPQANLDATIEALTKLGTVVNTQVSSEDVTTQIVDTEARLKNLRQQEAMTQKIMERTGSIKDVLAVSQQLSQVRDQIERLDAQVKQLKTQVAYSTIKLQLSAAIVGGPVNSNTFGQQVQDRWNRSTRGASQLVIGLTLLGIGLIPFLPFLLLLGAGLYVLRRRIKRGKLLRRRSATIVPPDAD
jgi:conjugal transfer/entry exclusion protein